MSPRRLALLVGINKYRQPEIAPLNGCVPDVVQFRDLITSKYGFAMEDTLLLTDEQATHAAIVSGFRNHLVAKSGAGDIAVFYYSGHGSQIPDANAPSGFHQTIVPHDSRDAAGTVLDISMTELNGMLGDVRQKTSNITAICDSCYSGNLVRGRVARVIAPDRRPQALPKPLSGGIAENTGIVFIAGCEANQVSNEDEFEGSAHGAMSFFLAKQLRADNPGLTWKDAMDTVTGEVLLRFPPQIPELKADGAHNLIFGGAGDAGRPYIVTNPGADAKHATLNAGLVHGITVGSQFDTFKPGTTDFSGTPAAKLTVTAVNATDSAVKVVSGGPVVVGSRSIERVLRLSTGKLRVFVDPTANVAKQKLGAMPQVKIVARRSNCDMAIRLKDGMVLTETPDFEQLSPPAAAAEAGLPDKIAARAELWAKWFHLLNLADSGSGGKVTVTIEPLLTNADGTLRSSPDENTPSARAKVTHTFAGPMFLSLLDLSGDGSVSPIVRDGDRDAVKPGVEAVFLLLTSVPDDRPSVRESLKAFATTTRVDLFQLQSAAIRGGESEPLNQLLGNALTGTRGDTPVPAGSWATATASVVVGKPV